jgi:hypothetical protein
MSDLNSMSMDDLVRFAEEGILPEGVHVEDNSSEGASDSSDSADMNDLSMDDLLAMAEGEDVGAGTSTDEGSGESEEASEDDLRALLENTLGEDELGGDDDHLEVAKGIEKIKLRQLANRIDTMAPAKLFPPRKDEVYYFLSSMAGQSDKIRIDGAGEKCAFIGKALKSLETFMLSEVGMSIEEQSALADLFEDSASEVVEESEQRDLVFQNFKFGWKQTLKRLRKDVDKLRAMAKSPRKPVVLVLEFYESLGRAYGLCRAQESLKEYADELSTEMSREQKRMIVDTFEEVVELAPFYGLKSIDFINRKQAYDSVAALNIPQIIAMLKKR